MEDGILKLEKISGAQNPTDMLTKTVTIDKLKLCSASVGHQRNGLALKFLGRIRQETRRQCLILRQSECYPSSEESIFSFQNEAHTVAVSLYPITSGRWDFET